MKHLMHDMQSHCKQIGPLQSNVKAELFLSIKTIAAMQINVLLWKQLILHLKDVVSQWESNKDF